MEAKHAVLGATATVVLVAVATFGYFRWQTPAPRHARALTPSGNARADDAQMRADFAAMQQEVQLVRAQLAGLQEHVGNVAKMREAEAQPEAAVAAKEVEPAKGEPAPRSQPRDLNVIEAQYMNLLDAQPVDAAWAGAEQNAIRDFVSRAAPEAQIEQLECRTSLCRLRVRLPTETALSNFRYQIGLPPLDHGGFFRIDPENKTLTYISPRAGSKLPDVAD